MGAALYLLLMPKITRYSAGTSEGEDKMQKKTTIKATAAKWTPEALSAGWTVIPSIIIEEQHTMGLDNVDLVILLNLAMHWWDANRPPFPRKRILADRMHLSESTIRRHTQKLEKLGLIKRVARFVDDERQTSNEYKLDGLVAKAKELALDKERRSKQRAEEDENARIARRRRNRK